MPRGGAYNYDWIENLLGLNMHSADEVLREFQHPQVGDTIGFGANHMRLERVEPEHVLAWRSEDGNWVWTFVAAEHETAPVLRLDRHRLGHEPTVDVDHDTIGARVQRPEVLGRVHGDSRVRRAVLDRSRSMGR